MELRKQALFWAAQQGTASTAQLAAIYDKNTDQEMKEQAIFTLAQRGNKDPQAVDKLLDIAKNDKNAELRKRAIFWLGQSKDPRAAKLLQQLIER
jgi:HEAT repeat protein